MQHQERQQPAGGRDHEQPLDPHPLHGIAAKEDFTLVHQVLERNGKRESESLDPADLAHGCGHGEQGNAGGGVEKPAAEIDDHPVPVRNSQAGNLRQRPARKRKHEHRFHPQAALEQREKEYPGQNPHIVGRGDPPQEFSAEPLLQDRVKKGGRVHPERVQK